MRFGVLHGYRGLLLENARALRRVLGRRARVVATGVQVLSPGQKVTIYQPKTPEAQAAANSAAPASQAQ